MCPENLTNLEDGSSRCDIPVRPGTNLLMRYAVIVSFGVYLKGTTLEAIASKVGPATNSLKSKDLLQDVHGSDVMYSIQDPAAIQSEPAALT